MFNRIYVKFVFRTLILMIFSLAYSSVVSAAPLTDILMSVTQPNGSVLNCFASGDECFNYLHDASGNIIIQHPVTGYYTYAQLDSKGKVTASGRIAVDGEHYYSFSAALNNPVPISAAGIKLDDIDFTINADLIHEFPNPEIMQPQAALHQSADIGIIGKTVKGNMENVIVMICFSDEDPTIPSAIKDRMLSAFNGASSSLNHYMKAVSGDVLVINSTLVGLNGNTVLMYKDSQPRGYYMPYNETSNPIGYTGGDEGDERRIREHTLLRSAVNAINGSSLLTGKNLDINNDGRVDSISFIINGNVGAWAQLLWPHQWSLYTYTVNLNGKRVYNYIFYLLDNLFPVYGSSALGIICHETLHTFGLPDLYRYTNNGTPVGYWDVMSHTTTNPQLPNTHLKRRYAGWGSGITEITKNGRYTLSPLGSVVGTTAYGVATSNPKQFILLEYRSDTNGSGYDTYFSTSTSYSKGLTITRINTSYSGNDNNNKNDTTNDEVYIYRPGETSLNRGNGSIANASLSTNRSRTSFGNNTAESGYNGTIYLYNGANTKYIVSNVSSAGNTISFDIQISPKAPDILYGDVNDDGEITYLDAIFIVMYINGWPVDINLIAADVSGDGEITYHDAVLISQHVNGLISKLPVVN